MISFKKLWVNKTDLRIVLPCLICALPLIYRMYPVTDLYDGVITATLLVISFFFILNSYCYNNGQPLSFSLTDVAILVFLSYVLINAFLKKPINSFTNNGLITLSSIPLYLCFRRVLRRQNSFNELLFTILTVTLVQLGYAFLQLLHLASVVNPQYKATGFFFNPNIFCAYLTLQYPLMIGYYSLSANRFVKTLCIACCCMIVFFDFFLLSRAAAFAVTLISSSLFWRTAVSKTQKRFAIAISVILLTAGVLFFTQVKTASTNGRLLIWKISAKMITEKPLTGLGSGGFQSKYNLYQAAYFNQNKSSGDQMLLADENYEPFNQFLSIVIDDGILGLLIFMILLVFIFWSKPADISRDQLIIFVKCAIFAFIFTGFFSYAFEEPFLFLNFILLTAVCATYSKSSRYLPANVRYVVEILLLVVGLGDLNQFYYLNLWLGQRSRVNIINKGFIDAKLYPYLQNNALFLSDYATELIKQQRYEAAIILLEKAKNIMPSGVFFSRLALLYNDSRQWQKAEDYLKEASAIAPARFKPVYLLFSFYRMHNNLSKATETGQKIMAMKIKMPSLEEDMIRTDVKDFLQKRIAPSCIKIR